MAADFITLAEAQSYLGIGATDPDFADPIVQQNLSWAIATTTQGIIDLLDRDPRLQRRTEFYSGTGSRVQPVVAYPVQNVVSLLVDSDSIDPVNLYWDNYCIYLRFGIFPRGLKNIQITYEAGLDPVPMPIKMAAMMWTKALYNGRDTDQNATGESYNGVLSQSFRPQGQGSCPPQAAALLNNYIQRYRISG